VDVAEVVGMISDAILGVVGQMLTWMVSILPTYAPSWTGALGAVPGYIGFANAFLPLSEMVQTVSWLIQGGIYMVTFWGGVKLVERFVV
jgi:hypothetical protein